MWIPQEPGRSSRLRLAISVPESTTQILQARAWSVRLSARERTNRTPSRYLQGKATNREGMGGWKSERLIVPVNRGNSPHEDPVEGRGRRISGNVGGNDDRDTELEHHLPWTPACSGPGEKCTGDGVINISEQFLTSGYETG